MVKILLSGCCGRMGRVIKRMCDESDKYEITAGIDISTCSDFDFPVFTSPADYTGDADVVIDFSNSSLLSPLLAMCLEKKLPLIVCTTGHSAEQLDELRNASDKIPVFRSGNMSIGINLLSDIVKRMTTVLGDGFNVEIVEKHHNKKVDAPSGTALMLADAVSQAMSCDAEYVYDRQSVRRQRGSNEIGIHSIRGGTIVGEHEVIFAGDDEIIEVKHTILSREVFASGALSAALFMANVKKPGMYSMTDVIASR